MQCKNKSAFFHRSGNVNWKMWAKRQVRQKSVGVADPQSSVVLVGGTAASLNTLAGSRKLPFLPVFLLPALAFGECADSVLPAAGFTSSPSHLTFITKQIMISDIQGAKAFTRSTLLSLRWPCIKFPEEQSSHSCVCRLLSHSLCLNAMSFSDFLKVAGFRHSQVEQPEWTVARPSNI